MHEVDLLVDSQIPTHLEHAQDLSELLDMVKCYYRKAELACTIDAVCVTAMCSVLQVLNKFDEQQSGTVSERSLLSASAACNILMSDKERDYVLSTLDPQATHQVNIAQFLREFCGQ